MSRRIAKSRARPRRRWLLAAALITLIVLAAGRTGAGVPAHADSDDDWIATAVARADLDEAEAAKFAACLRAKLTAGVDRLAALGPCLVDATLPTSAEGVLAGLVDPEAQATLNARNQAATAAANQILADLQARGATQGEIENLRPQLIACVQAWAPLTDNVNDIVGWCRQDVSDFDSSLRAHPEPVDPLAPVIADFGCPDDLTVNQQFDCLPRIVGTITEIGYAIDNAPLTKTTDPRLTITLQDSEEHVLDLAVCNAGHCNASELRVQASLPAPTGGSVGCPATAKAGATFTCTPAGWSPTDEFTNYTWNASAGGSQTNIGDSYDITFPNDGTNSITVSVRACNGNSVLSSHPNHCTPLTATVSLAGAAGAPQGSISCTPASGPASADNVLSVTCTANLTNVDQNTTYSWSSPGAIGSAGANNTWVALLDKPATNYVITLTVCNGSDCFSPSFTVSTDASAPTGSISCAPATGNATLTVNCTSNVTGTIPFTTTYGWTTTGTPASAPDNPFAFTVTFDKPGNQTVTLRVCNGSACNSLSTTVTVNPPLTPPGGSIACGPLTANTGDRISCTAQLAGTVTATTWSASNGNPPSGQGTTFTTSYTTTGAQTITLQACNGAACSVFTASVNILRKPDAAPSPAPPAQRQPITITGSITVTEGDVGCGFSAMPSSTGTITITLTFGSSPGDPIVANGNFSGGSSGSRTVHCAGGTATENFQASYSANFNGVVPQGGGAINLTGTMRVTQSTSYSNCQGNDGSSGACPPPASSTSYPAAVTGTITIPPSGQGASGSGSLTMQSGCSTAGQWNAH